MLHSPSYIAFSLCISLTKYIHIYLCTCNVYVDDCVQYRDKLSAACDASLKSLLTPILLSGKEFIGKLFA